jgi:IS5 family transposase
MKLQKQPTLADSICDLRTRKIKITFFTQINTIIDWSKISAIIDKDYKKGKSAVGQPSYDGLLLFKMCLLQSWYGLSDYEVEDRVNDSLSFSYFCGMTIEQTSPDHSTLSRFRTCLTKAKTFESSFSSINSQLVDHNIIVKKGVIVDASVVDTPLRPKGKTKYEVTQDREKEVEVKKDYAESVDKDGTWLKKRGKYHFGYKKHHVTDEEGIVVGVLTTTASKNEISNLEDVLDSVNVELPKDIPLKADKGYQSKKNAALLKKRKLKNHILKKAVKNKPLTKWEKRFNKLIGKTRFKVERTFGGNKVVV